MNWNRNEIEHLAPILEQVSADLAPVDGKQVLVLGSGSGEVAFWLAEMMEQGKVMGLEFDPPSLEISRHAAHEMGLENVVEFLPAEKQRIPLPDASSDALVSELIVYPSSAPAKIGQVEMFRVLKPGGKIILTDILLSKSVDPSVREAFQFIGLDFLHEATQADFRSRMASAGWINLHYIDLTPTLRRLWESRRASDLASTHQAGYAYLLDDPEISLGNGVFYIYLSAEKPKSGG
jgi:ubiquinone/menaquinone biosynthesis C-methylase UbiE